MTFPGKNYAPAGVYTQTRFENPIQGVTDDLVIPVFIGEGNEFLSQTDLSLVRGSSSIVDQEIAGEDATGRSVTDISSTGVVSLGSFDGVRNRIQTRMTPIVDGQGLGRTSTKPSDVSVTINDTEVVVIGIDGVKGVLTLAQPPRLGDQVRVHYFFNREDTRITEDLSSQVTETSAQIYALTGLFDVNAPTPGTASLDLHGDQYNSNGGLIAPANNVLNLVVDGVSVSITLTPKSDYTMRQVANVITAANQETLTATTVVNNEGESTLLLSSDGNIIVEAGSLNALVGLQAGQSSARKKTFYTNEGPIVDGSNGGIATTDVSHVVVKVDGVTVTPESVDGASRAITLTSPPKAGSTLTVSYWFNAWQDTFDYLGHVGITEIQNVGDVQGGSQYIQGADYVLHDDKILWGTAALVDRGLVSTEGTPFDERQIGLTLVDNKTFLSPTEALTSTQFLLPFTPTLGNGRSTTLGQSLFQSASNNRIGLPVNRTDVVKAYWGFSVSEALAKGSVEIVQVEGSTITLKEKVPAGASVYASFYYSRMTDATYTITAGLSGPSSVGTYKVSDADGSTVYSASLRQGSKSAGLTGIPLEFPSGSELTPDTRLEGVSGASFTGPVDETVLVTFLNTQATPARFTFSGSSPYAFVDGESDLISMSIGTNTVFPAAGSDLSSISIGGGGVMAHLVGSEVPYPDDVEFSADDFTSGNETIDLTLDNDIVVSATVQSGAGITVDDYVSAINEAANGAIGVSDANSGTASSNAGADSLTDASLLNLDVEDYYVGWVVVLGDHAVVGAPDPGEIRTVTTQVTGDHLTLDSNWSSAMDAAIPYRIYNPETVATFKGATRFDSAIDLNGGFQDITIAVNATNTAGAVEIDASLPADTYASAAALAAALNTTYRGASGSDILTPPAIGSPIALAIVTDSLLEGLDFIFSADADGRITLTPQLPGLSDAGFFAFVEQAAVADDFCHLAGIDTDSSVAGDQVKLNIGEIAKSYRITLGTQNPYDRLILRNRIHPGGNSQTAHDAVEQTKLLVGGGSGNTKAGLVTGDYGEAGHGATVQNASLLGRISLAEGMDAATSQPSLTFFDGTGAEPANNLFEFTLDGNPVSVEFTASDTGTATLLGLLGNAGSVLSQIRTAMSNIPGAPFGSVAAIETANLIEAEGCGIRITSAKPDSSGQVVVNSGTANSILGFTSGDVAARSLVSAHLLASAMNSDRETSLADFMHDFSATSSAKDEFAAQAVAHPITDAQGRVYLHVVSAGSLAADYGSSSSITLNATNTRSWLFVGSGVDELDGASSSGTDALNGFNVQSSKLNSGSGSAHTALSGKGQDGVIGQTYRDEVTGLTFTILPRGWSDDSEGPWADYPSGSTFILEVRSEHTTDANLPVRSIPGVEMIVSNTSDVSTEDTAIVTTYPRTGQEPSIGDIYYVSYTYTKESFKTSFFTKLSAVEAAYGPISVDNPVSLAAYLAAINGAALFGVKQVPREEGSNQASIGSYFEAVDELERPLPGQIRPDIITPLRGDSTELYQRLARSNSIQSSIRYRSERTSLVGVAAGTTPAQLKALVANLKNDRMRVVYPDMIILPLEETNSSGNLVRNDVIVAGPYLAAMMVGSNVSPNRDPATPWTRRELLGASGVARILTEVEKNQIAQAGATVVEEALPVLRVRDAFTTDMTNELTKRPTVRQISDSVQQLTRSVLDGFIGVKYLPGILTQVEGRLSKLFQSLIKRQILASYTGVRASADPENPTGATVEAYYQPVFPLLYIVVSYSLTSNTPNAS